MSSISMSAGIADPGVASVWRDDSGTVHAVIRFGGGPWPYLAFTSAADARGLAAVCTAAAEAMDALPPPEAVP